MCIFEVQTPLFEDLCPRECNVSFNHLKNPLAAQLYDMYFLVFPQRFFSIPTNESFMAIKLVVMTEQEAGQETETRIFSGWKCSVTR